MNKKALAVLALLCSPAGMVLAAPVIVVSDSVASSNPTAGATEADAEEIRFVSEEGRLEAALLRAVGGTANNVVAGARFTNFRHVIKLRP
jgi:hypothetical protein